MTIKWTRERRLSAPLEIFAQPEQRQFPIDSVDDVLVAVKEVTKAYEDARTPERIAELNTIRSRIVAIAKRLGLRGIPSHWESGPAPNPAHAAMSDDDWVLYPDSLLFRIGEFPDKDFSMSPAELRAAVARFGDPVPIDLEHVSSVLDNKLGELRSVRLSDDGTSLLGTVAIPRWLDGVLEPGKRKVSAAWDRATKTLRSLALVVNPRVADAALMAAFNRTARHRMTTNGDVLAYMAEQGFAPADFASADFASRDPVEAHFSDTPEGRASLARYREMKDERRAIERRKSEAASRDAAFAAKSPAERRAEVDALLAMTEEGREALRRRKARESKTVPGTSA